MTDELSLLIEDYERRIKTVEEEKIKNVGKMKYSRLAVKASCYRSFLAELTRLKNNLTPHQ